MHSSCHIFSRDKNRPIKSAITHLPLKMERHRAAILKSSTKSHAGHNNSMHPWSISITKHLRRTYDTRRVGLMVIPTKSPHFAVLCPHHSCVVKSLDDASRGEASLSYPPRPVTAGFTPHTQHEDPIQRIHKNIGSASPSGTRDTSRTLAAAHQ